MSKGYSKYHARKTVVDGITFDSAREAKRYSELRVMEQAGLITNLARQVKYPLSESFRSNGKVVLRACSYVADFVYVENGETVVEDAKGFKTPEYTVKKKWLADKYGILIREV